MSKKRLPILILAMLAVITLMLPSSAFAASVSISTRSCTSYFQVYNGTEWHDYTAPQHYITGSSPEQVAYCMQQTKTSPSGSSYTTTDILDSYSAHTNLGLQIILENGYPFTTPSGLTAAEARYATANAIRFWLAEEGDDYQYNYDDFSAYTDAQLRTYAAAGKIGSKVRTVSSSYNDILQFSIELLIAARSQTVPPHTITFSPSTLNLALSNGYFTGTTTVTLNNMEGGYTLISSALPSGSSVSGFTGNSGDVLTVKIPVSAANSSKTIQLSATGYDDRTRTNIFAYAPSSSSYQKMLTATVGDSYMENVGSATLSVKTPAMPDLIVTSLSTDNSSYESGDTVTVTATIKNQGTANAGAFTVQLTPGTLTKQTANITSLAVNASQNVTFTFTTPLYSSDTVLALTVAADSGNVITELDESNNARSTNITVKAAKPDLIVSSLTTDKSSYNTVDTITVTATIKNQGTASAEAFAVQLTPGTLAKQSTNITSLAVNATQNVTFTFTAPVYTIDTVLTLTVTADSGNAITELDEGNNTRSTNITVKAAQPDLVVSALNTDKSSYDAGDIVTVTATIKNQGAASAGAFAVQLAPGTLTKQTTNITSLAANAAQNVTFTFTAPVYTSDTVLTLTVTADSGNAIAELDEGNNTRSTNITIKAAKPDLIVSALNTDKSSYDAGDTITVTATIKNQGAASAGAFAVQLTPGTLSKQTTNITSLAMNAAQNVTFTFTAPVYTSDTILALTVMADSGNAITELDESNNTKSTNITIKAAKPDLTITSLTTDKASYNTGETVTAIATVANIGYVSVSSCEVSLTPGSLATITKTTGTINPNGSTNVVFTFTIPAGTPSGNMLITADADPNNKIAEINETNNSRTYNIAINVSVPDLTITALTTDKQTYDAGDTVTISATAANLGQTNVSASDVRLTPGSLQPITKTTGLIAGNGGSTVVTFTFTAPSQLTSFTLTLTATADPDNKIAESDETNNSRSMSILVNAVRPDIVIIDANTTDWYAGYDVLVSATVKDLSIQPVPSVKIRLKAGNVQVDEIICVPANGSNLAVFRFTVPSLPVPPGTMPLVVTITADPDNVVNEVNENNNTWTKTQTVSYAPAAVVVDPDSSALEQDNPNRNKVIPALPQANPSTYHTWQEVRLENGSYTIKNFWAQLDTVFSISPDPRIAYPDNPDVMESGFGVMAYCKTTLTTNYDHPEKLIGPQMVWVYYPESSYGQGLWQNVRDSLESSSGSIGAKIIEWQYAVNPYSATRSRLHYIPLWFPDGQYTALAQAIYAWTPIGQMVDYETDSITIEGDMYDRIAVVRR